MVEEHRQMKNCFKKFLPLILFFVFSCGLSKKTPAESVSMTSFTKWMTEYQIDSLCAHDNLARNFDEWFSMPFYDYETGATINRKMYIKYFGEPNEVVYYFITQTDSLYEFTKRITTKTTTQ